MSPDELKATLENSDVPLEERIKALITEVPQIQGLADRAWLGEILLHTITEEQEVDFKEKISSLRTKVAAWHAKSLAIR